jgi:hypothetical protein
MMAARSTVGGGAPGPLDTPLQTGPRREGERYWTMIPLNSTTYSFSVVKIP